MQFLFLNSDKLIENAALENRFPGRHFPFLVESNLTLTKT